MCVICIFSHLNIKKTKTHIYSHFDTYLPPSFGGVQTKFVPLQRRRGRMTKKIKFWNMLVGVRDCKPTVSIAPAGRPSVFFRVEVNSEG